MFSYTLGRRTVFHKQNRSYDIFLLLCYNISFILSLYLLLLLTNTSFVIHCKIAKFISYSILLIKKWYHAFKNMPSFIPEKNRVQLFWYICCLNSITVTIHYINNCIEFTVFKITVLLHEFTHQLDTLLILFHGFRLVRHIFASNDAYARARAHTRKHRYTHFSLLIRSGLYFLWRKQ